jgi:uncharacterized cupredoxin-like copper-binding protein
MRRLHLRFAVPALGACLAVALLAALGTGGSAPAAVSRTAAVKPAASPRVSVVTVTAGKPSELAFKLSKSSMIPSGTVTFKVTNMGVAFHNFKICAKPLASATDVADACTGKATKILKHGQSATLTVTLSAKGKYEFLCTVTGHAAAGMRGLLGVGVAVSSGEQKIAATADSSAATTGSSGGGSGGSAGKGTGGGDNGATGCPPGVTVKTSGNADADGDELGTEPDDQDGCV